MVHLQHGHVPALLINQRIALLESLIDVNQLLKHPRLHSVERYCHVLKPREALGGLLLTTRPLCSHVHRCHLTFNDLQRGKYLRAFLCLRRQLGADELLRGDGLDLLEKN